MRIFISVAAMVLSTACGGLRDDGGSGGETTTFTTSTTSAANSTSIGSGGAGNTGSGGATATGSGGASTGGNGTGGAATGSDGWGPLHCPSAPPGVKVGFEIGDQVGDIMLKDCDDNDVSLTAFCGADALFVFAAYGWCPLCQSISGMQEAITDGFAGKNLASVNVIVQNGQADPPDAHYCKVWRDAHGHEDVVTLYDPTGAVLALWNGGGSSSYSAFLDSDRVILGKLTHSADVGAIEAGIQGALDH